MKIEKLPLEGALLLTPIVHADSRGSFSETFQKQVLVTAGINQEFVQDNEARSARLVLRGLHFQRPPYAQSKLVRVAKGRVIDVIVDIRKNSATYGKHLSVELSEDNHKMLWVPAGFAHGYVSLSEDSVFLYKVTCSYNKASEGGIIWNDTTLAIDWGLDGERPVVSEKDQLLPSFVDLGEPF